MDCPVQTIDGLQFCYDNLQYNLVEYEDEYFKRYVSAIKEYTFYDTGVKLTPEDHIITLQTCVSGNVNKRLVLIGREFDRRKVADIE